MRQTLYNHYNVQYRSKTRDNTTRPVNIGKSALIMFFSIQRIAFIMEEFSKHMNPIKGVCLFQRNFTDLNISKSSDFLSAFQLLPNLNAFKSQAKNTLNATSAEKQSCGTGPCSFLLRNTESLTKESCSKKKKTTQKYSLLCNTTVGLHICYI